MQPSNRNLYSASIQGRCMYYVVIATHLVGHVKARTNVHLQREHLNSILDKATKPSERNRHDRSRPVMLERPAHPRRHMEQQETRMEFLCQQGHSSSEASTNNVFEFRFHEPSSRCNLMPSRDPSRRADEAHVTHATLLKWHAPQSCCAWHDDGAHDVALPAKQCNKLQCAHINHCCSGRSLKASPQEPTMKMITCA